MINTENTEKKKPSLRSIIMSVLAVIVVGVTVFLFLNHMAKTNKEEEAAEAAEQAKAQLLLEQAIAAHDKDIEFFIIAKSKVEEAKAKERQAELARVKANRDDKVAGAKNVLSESKGKVLDNGLRQTLSSRIETTEESQIVITITKALKRLDNSVKAVEESVDEWEAEEDRKAEEERQAEIAKQAEQERKRQEQQDREYQEQQQQEQQQQEQQQQQQATPPSQSGSSGSSGGSSSGGNSSSSSGGSSGSSSSGSSSSGNSSGDSSSGSGGSSSGGSASYRSQVASVLAKHGCGSASISIDDPHLGGWNGKADWVGNGILVKSGLGGRMPYVVAHECVHLKQYQIYGGDVNALSADMNRIYGGSGYNGLEHNADCVTKRWGYSQYNFTNSCGGARGSAAAAIASGGKP